jgi:hypothetical protein
LILTPWSDYKAYARSDLLNRFSGKIIIDPFQVLDKEFCKLQRIEYLTIGQPSN